MTYLELQTKIKEILPGASLETDNEGQIIIYTNLKEIEDQDELEEYEA